jgi:hypothetical protein
MVTPTYINGFQNGPKAWTGVSSCASGSSNNNVNGNWAFWNAMSIVSDSATDQQFSYPNTAMAGWLCRSTQEGIPMNNSSAQAQLYYKKINSTNSVYSVNAIVNCPSAEGVYEPGAVESIDQATSGLVAIENHMETQCHSGH